MKYAVLIGDGMADYPIPELGGRTPLEVARTPNMDFLARRGTLGRTSTLPTDMPAGSDVAQLSIMGYDPRKCYPGGRGPLEAASMRIDLSEGEFAYRCNLVTVRDGMIVDYCAGHISTEEARTLISLLDGALGGPDVRFYPGVSYRHLAVISGVGEGIEATPPHDIMGEPFLRHLPRGSGSELLIDLIRRSWDVLKDCPVNRDRESQGKPPANMIWLWGQGAKPKLPTFRERFSLKGAVISAVDLIRGIGVLAGLDVIEVPGATGYLDTNYRGKAEYALRALETRDLVYIHVEAPDEAGHNGNLGEKIEAIERFDSDVVGTILAGLPELGEHKILVMPDHYTPISRRTHTREAVPFAIYDSRNDSENPSRSFEEKSSEGTLSVPACELMGRLLGKA
ncbi:MAG: cofactor-independent phosphoglycerate mutase [bacterium]